MCHLNAPTTWALLVALVCLVGASTSTVRADEKLKLGVFIESLCPDSRRFFVRQLVPTYRLIGDLFEPNIVPFGHARVQSSTRMICQHGQRECQGNRRMACIRARATNTSQQVETIGCLFENQSTPKECVERNMANVTWKDIDDCSGAPESMRMMEQFEKETGRVSYIPHLTLDGRHDEAIQEGAEHDLKNFICKNYQGSKPQACK